MKQPFSSRNTYKISSVFKMESLYFINATRENLGQEINLKFFISQSALKKEPQVGESVQLMADNPFDIHTVRKIRIKDTVVDRKMIYSLVQAVRLPLPNHAVEARRGIRSFLSLKRQRNEHVKE